MKVKLTEQQFRRIILKEQWYIPTTSAGAAMARTMMDPSNINLAGGESGNDYLGGGGPTTSGQRVKELLEKAKTHKGPVSFDRDAQMILQDMKYAMTGIGTKKITLLAFIKEIKDMNQLAAIVKHFPLTVPNMGESLIEWFEGEKLITWKEIWGAFSPKFSSEVKLENLPFGSEIV